VQAINGGCTAEGHIRHPRVPGVGEVDRQIVN
jgi:hypothetical protein